MVSREVNKSSSPPGFDLLADKPRSYRIHYPYSHYVLGQISVALTSWFYRRGWSANAVTALSFVVLVAALAMIAVSGPGRVLMIVGVLALQAVLILDNVDGNIAQVTDSSSELGALADAFVSWVHYSILPICVGWALFASPPETWQKTMGIAVPGGFWLATGILRSLACLATVIVGQRCRRKFAVSGYEQLTRAHRSLLLVRFFMEAEALLLLFATVLTFVGILHVAYVFLQLAVMFVVVAKCSRQSGKGRQSR